MEFSFSVFSLMLSKLPALSSLNPNMTFWEWCANMTWTKYFFFIKSIFHVHSRTWVIMWGFHILLFSWWGIFSALSKMYLLFIISNTTICGFQREVEKAYSTWYYQAVSHPSTNQAGPCLASEIRRDRAYSGWYGRKPMLPPTIPYLYKWIYQGKCSIKQNEGDIFSEYRKEIILRTFNLLQSYCGVLIFCIFLDVE